jgi:hypothetical protein
MFPHERSLVKRMEGKPFALLGVNSVLNGERYDDAFRQKLTKHQISWRSFKDNRPLDGSIHTEWCLNVHPTLILIDHQGVIRNIWHGSPGEKVLDKEIDKFVKLAEDAVNETHKIP